MRKLYTLTFLTAFLLIGAVGKAQIDPPCMYGGAYVCDNIDAYAAGDPLGPNASWFTTWSGTEGGAEDAIVSDEQAYSMPNSIHIPEGGVTDCIWKLGNQTSGQWRLQWMMYIPDGSTGYYNIQESETPGVAWNLELMFGLTDYGVPAPSGTGRVTIPDGDEFSYPVDQWFKIEQIIDLDADNIKVYVDGVMVMDYLYGGSIGCIDFYSIDENNYSFIDDVLLTELVDADLCAIPGAMLCDNIEGYDAGTTLGMWADWWTTWDGIEGTAEDALVSSDQAYSGINSVHIPEGGVTDCILRLGNLNSGVYRLQWMMYVPDGKTGYYNIQESETPGVAWNLELMFGLTDYGVPAPSGTGRVTIPDGDEFSYPVGEWFPVEHVIDLDADNIQVWVNGVLVMDYLYGGNIGSIDFYSIDENNSSYIDDVLLIDNNLALNTYYEDADGDGYGNPDVSVNVGGAAPDGYVADNTDCDDTNVYVNPGETEVCNDIDDNCDGNIDEGVLITYYADADGDNYGDADMTDMACSAPTGYVADNTDCDDTNAFIFPGATEVANGVDDDCDGLVDENVGIENTVFNAIAVYPVPASDNVTLELGAIAGVHEAILNVFNSYGQLVYSTNVQFAAGNSITVVPMSAQASGIYMMQITAENDVITRQITIQH
ncbi:MAG: MopE-related protein [Chitinophagales bacterium]